MQSYTDLLPPTAVTHAVSLPFLHPQAINLVLAKTSLLQVFAIKSIPSGIHDDDDSDRASLTSRLHLIAHYPLSGTVTALASVKTLNTKTGGDALLVATKDAKISLVEWDPGNYRISTISIHYYEGENILSPPFGPGTADAESILAVDANSRCAALKFGARHLAILPFRQLGDDLADGIEDDGSADMDAARTLSSLQRTLSHLDAIHPPDSDSNTQTPYKSSFVLSLPTLDPVLTHPIHMSFLHEYRDLTLGLLTSSVQPSSALLAERKDCCTFTAFALDVEEHSSTRIQLVEKLPSDLWKVVSLARPVGGSLLVGTNEFVHVDQSGKINAVAVNEFAMKASNVGMVDQSALGMKLEGCEIATLDSSSHGGDLLIVLNDARLAILTFKILGRSVSGMSVMRVSADRGGDIMQAAPSCTAAVGDKHIFVGSEDGDSSLIAWRRQNISVPASSRKRSYAQMLDRPPPPTADDDDDDHEDGEDGEEDIDEDNLYAPSAGSALVKRSASIPTGGRGGRGSEERPAESYAFEVQDELRSIAPINDICFGRSLQTTPQDKLQLLAAVGRGHASRLALLSREIAPERTGRDMDFAGPAVDVWSVNVTRKHGDAMDARGVDVTMEDGEAEENTETPPPTIENDQNDLAGVRRQRGRRRASEQRENLLFVYDGDRTNVYTMIDDDNIAEHTGTTEFESDGETVFIGTLANHSRIVQCRRNEIRTYDPGLGLSQIIPMLDEETDAELSIVGTSFADPYLLVLRDDGSVLVLKVDDAGSGDVEPLDAPAEGVMISEMKWRSGCLYPSASAGQDPTGKDNGGVDGRVFSVWLLGQDGTLHIFSLPDLHHIYTAASLPHLPPVLQAGDTPQRWRGVGASKEILTEMLVADLGETRDGASNKQPYLIVRTAMDEMTLYEPLHYSDHPATNTTAPPPSNVAESKLSESLSYFAELRFRKVSMNTYTTSKYDDTEDDNSRPSTATMRAVQLGGYHCVYIPTGSGQPSFIVKEAASIPQILPLRVAAAAKKGVKAFSPLSLSNEADRFILIHTDGTLQESRFPAAQTTDYSTGWSVRTLEIGKQLPEEVRHLAFHEDRGVYVVATCREVNFWLPQEEDGGRSGGVEQDEITLRPRIPQYTLHLLSATTHNLIGSFEMPYAEIVTSLKVMPLEVSEHTHEQKLMVVVGTAAQRGEDLPAKGAVTVFDIIDVVPEPGRPETGVKLHIFAREETKGAITAVEGFPGGLLGTAQGQKIMIRGLKEDGACLPVAFLDAQCHMTQLKTLAASGMWLAGDVWKGLWFGGFVHEPYKLQLLGKSRTHMEVMAAEFLPFDGQLFLMVIDADLDLHVLQYDPENPKSLSGTRLLHKSTFHLGHFPTGMMLLPSTLVPDPQPALTNGHTNGEAETGSNEKAPFLFQVLVTFQTGAVGIITPVDESTYRRLGAMQTQLTSILEHAAGLNPRAYRAVESEAFGGRGLIDGSLLQRIGELGAARRMEVLGRAGGDVWSLRSDLGMIAAGGLGYV